MILLLLRELNPDAYEKNSNLHFKPVYRDEKQDKRKDESEHYIDFGESTYMAYTSSNSECDTGIVRYGYTSMT